MQLQMQDTNRETTTNPTSGSRKWTDLVDAMRINPEVDAMADAMQEEVWRSVHSRIRRQGRWRRIWTWWVLWRLRSCRKPFSGLL